ncbi:MAG: SUMF1/EgtB/PvdO family nonheme iron enzyme, partial [Verrucomicrobia bacterium]|nr:SUMF1/EgtB/PvdO family nonheme iron enzyme [Verrucomicrobiota bacterium]
MKVQLISSLVGLALTGAMVYAEEPTISYAIKMEISYTGVLYQSTDGETWTKVEGATNPYYVAMDEAKKLFFCSKDESESKDVTIPLSEDVDLDMIWIRSGTFTMGSPEDELGRYDDETQHEVTLTQGYWLGKYEVTQAQYEAVMGTNPSVTQGDDLPVQKVSWTDAMEFCATLTKIERAAGRLPEGYEYTLPTEAQWEYACRAGTMTALNSGKNLSSTEKCPEMDEVGWYVGNGSNKTHPVGQKLPNAWGLYDMHGNVYEWCLDWYGEDEPASSVTDPTGPETGSTRLIRGGCWNEVAIFCRSAFRNYTTPASSDSYIGFRVALAPVPVPTKDMTIPLSEDVNLDMIWIEPGTFLMGSPEDELGRSTNEVQHQVTL